MQKIFVALRKNFPPEVGSQYPHIIRSCRCHILSCQAIKGWSCEGRMKDPDLGHLGDLGRYVGIVWGTTGKQDLKNILTENATKDIFWKPCSSFAS